MSPAEFALQNGFRSGGNFEPAVHVRFALGRQKEIAVILPVTAALDLDRICSSFRNPERRTPASLPALNGRGSRPPLLFRSVCLADFSFAHHTDLTIKSILRL